MLRGRVGRLFDDSLMIVWFVPVVDDVAAGNLVLVAEHFVVFPVPPPKCFPTALANHPIAARSRRSMPFGCLVVWS